MTTKTMTNPPPDVNTVYDMAANWIKTHSMQRHGTLTMFVKPMPRKPNAGKKQEGDKDGDKKQVKETRKDQRQPRRRIRI
jgi:hypothetical protein